MLPTRISKFESLSGQQSPLFLILIFATVQGFCKSTCHQGFCWLFVCVHERSIHPVLSFPSTAKFDDPHLYVEDCFVGFPLAIFPERNQVEIYYDIPRACYNHLRPVHMMQFVSYDSFVLLC